jgi:titin
MVTAWNTAGATDSGSFTVNVNFPPPSGLVAKPVLLPLDANGVYPDQITLTWTNNASAGTIYEVWRGIGAALPTLLVSLGAQAPGAQTYVDSTVVDGVTYTYKIFATQAVVAPTVAATATSNSATVTAPLIFIAPPTGFIATPNAAGTLVTLSWVDRANNETSYLVEEQLNGGAWTALPTLARTAAQKTAVGATVTQTRVVTPGNKYAYRVTAQNKPSDSSVVLAAAIVDLTAPLAPTAPSGLTATLASATRVALAWVDNATTENSYLVTITNTTTNVVTTATVTRTAAQSLATGGALVAYNATVVAGNSYSFTVVAQATRYGLTTQSTATGPATMVVGIPTAPTIGTAVAGAAGSISVNWVDNSSNESGFTVQRSLMAVNGTWGAWANAGTVAAGVQTFLNTGLTTGRSYRYQVRANGVVGNSIYVGPSNTVVAP